MQKIFEVFKIVIKKASLNTLSTVWRLTKIIVPVTFFITFIKMTGILDIISNLFAPLMQIFNLPGDASLPLILGAFVNLYGAIGAIESLELSGNQITTIAIMLLIAHSLILETAVISTIGVKRKTQTILRVCVAIIAGLIVSLILGGLYG